MYFKPAVWIALDLQYRLIQTKLSRIDYVTGLSYVYFVQSGYGFYFSFIVQNSVSSMTEEFLPLSFKTKIFF